MPQAYNPFAFSASFDGSTSTNRASMVRNRSSFTSAKKLLSAYAQQSKPRSIKDTFTPSSSLEEVSFGLSRNRGNSVDGASPMLISSKEVSSGLSRRNNLEEVSFGLSNKAIDKASPGLNARIDLQA